MVKITEQISAVILAGGLARRMQGVEKGLQLLAGKPLISHILARLQPQLANGQIYLNINRDIEAYQRTYPQLPFYQDTLADFQGALSGMLTGLQQIESEYLLFVPCDSPFLPTNLLARLYTALKINEAKVAYAHNGERPQPTFALVHRSVATDLSHYLQAGERKLYHFFRTQQGIAVDFSDQVNAFKNINTLDDLALENQRFHRVEIPVLAITGYSGTGKTTLLEKLIPNLTACGIRVGLIKHSHHHIDVDKAGKDSHRLRLAGANPTAIVCDQRWALMVETPNQAVNFQQIFAKFSSKEIDLLFVEGFKQEALPKIQLHRKAMAQPLPELDEWTIATATDYPIARENLLNINDIDEISQFVQRWLTGKKRKAD